MIRRALIITSLIAITLLIVSVGALSVSAAPLSQATNPGINGLVGCWDLGEASGTRNDWSANALHLTDNNTVTQTTGVVGNAASFVAANSEYLSHADNATLSTGDVDFQVSAWVNLASKSSIRVIASKYGAPNAEWALWFDTTSDRFQFVVSGNGSATTTISANNFGSPSTGTWYYVRAWHDSVGNTINISVNNGTANSTAHSTGAFDGTSQFRIGATPAGFYWDGGIDQVDYRKYIFTANEALYQYNAGAGRSCADLSPAATATPTATNTPTNTSTPTATFTPSATPTITPTPTPTSTPDIAIWGTVENGAAYKIDMSFTAGDIAIVASMMFLGMIAGLHFLLTYLIPRRFTRDVGDNVSH